MTLSAHQEHRQPTLCETRLNAIVQTANSLLWVGTESGLASFDGQGRNKALVLEAFDTLSNKRNYEAAERYWPPNYIQHSAHIEPGREGLFNLVKALPATLKHEAGAVVAEGDLGDRAWPVFGVRCAG